MAHRRNGRADDVPAWNKELASLVARRKYSQAFRLLDRVIENDLPLFRDNPEVLEGRRMAWLCRVDLLKERGRLAEALAWMCLECEINPSDVTAQALKEQLKRNLGLGSRLRTNRPQMPSRESGGWEGVAGMREMKATLERDFILPLQQPELHQMYKVSIPNGILFYGPPGCGKTFIAQALAKKLGYEFFDVKPSDLASPYVHGTQGKIAKLFDNAASNAPAVIFCDELDALIPDRSGSNVGHHYATEVNEFLVQLNDCSARNIAVIGATNFLRKVDPAARRPGRLDKHIFIGPPDIEARLEAISLYLKGRPQTTIDGFTVAEFSEECSFAELKLIVDEAARAALAERRPITTEDLLAALDANPPQPKMSKDAYL